MHVRSFLSKITQNQEKKFLLHTTVEWHTSLTPYLEKQIIQTHVASFLDLYSNYTEAQLGLPSGTSKQTWLTDMVSSDLKDFKEEKCLLATVSIENSVAGFITCLPTKHRHDKMTSHQIIQGWRQQTSIDPTLWQDTIRKDAYISLLAVKPFRDRYTGEKIRIGLGRQLIESALKKMHDATTLTLDTRLINTQGIAFYKSLGFSTTGEHTFGTSNSRHYTGLEKQIRR